MNYYPLISIMPKAAGFDPDAQAFITAAAITDVTQQGAINTLVVSLKGYSIWTKFKAIYPIVGGVASSHKYNLKDPRDLDVAFRLQFTNSWTHSSTGMTPSAAWANTFLTPSTSLSLNSTHVSYYSRTQVIGFQIDMGIINVGGGGGQVYVVFNYNTQRFVAINNSGAIVSLLANTTGMLIENRRNATQIQSYKSGVLVNTGAIGSALVPNLPIYLGAYNNGGTAAGNSTKQCAFASIGEGLTDTEAANFYTAVQAYQTTLGREMIENQQLELDAGNTNSYPGTGTTWTDVSNNSRTGTLIAGVGYSSLNGGSLTFNGSNQYVNVANTTSVLSNVNKFTLNTWFKLNNPALNNTIFSFGTASNFSNDILIGVYGSTIFAQVNNGGDGSGYPVASFTSTAWTNCQIVFDGTQTGNANRLKMYINGVLQTLTYSYTVPSTTGTTSTCGIGAYSTPGFNSNFLNGDVSVTELYSSALDQTQVTQNFNNIKTRYGL